ncbi:Predicted protein (fragment) [Xanthomonas citri pv. citri]
MPTARAKAPPGSRPCRLHRSGGRRRGGCRGHRGRATPRVVGANACTPVGGLFWREVQIGQGARVVVRVHAFFQGLVTPLVAAALQQIATDAAQGLARREVAMHAFGLGGHFRYGPEDIAAQRMGDDLHAGALGLLWCDQLRDQCRPRLG